MRLQWFVGEGEDLRKEYFAGTLTPEGSIEVELALWNNRGETERAAKDCVSPTMLLRFDSVEDTALLSFCTIDIDETVGISPSIEDGVARVLIPGTISGKPNDGTYDYENRENYKSITVRISPNGRRLKVSDIKNLYIDIVADNHE